MTGSHNVNLYIKERQGKMETGYTAKERCGMLNHWKQNFCTEEYIRLLETLLIMEWEVRYTRANGEDETSILLDNRGKSLEEYLKD